LRKLLNIVLVLSIKDNVPHGQYTVGNI